MINFTFIKIRISLQRVSKYDIFLLQKIYIINLKFLFCNLSFYYVLLKITYYFWVIHYTVIITYYRNFCFYYNTIIMHCIIWGSYIFIWKKWFFVLIRIFGYPDMLTDKSCPTCPDKWISTVFDHPEFCCWSQISMD